MVAFTSRPSERSILSIQFLIRSATLDDIPLLPAIEKSAGELFRTWPGLEWVATDETQSESQHRALIEKGLSLAATTVEDIPIAFLNGEVLDEHLHILLLAVQLDYQRQGVGRRLVEEATRHASRRSLTSVTLTTFRRVPWNEPYYRRLGFITLEEDALTPGLRDILAAEARAGFSPAQRCAMMLRLSSKIEA